MNLSLEPDLTTCPKCQFRYTCLNTGSDSECPACGVFHDKYLQHHSDTTQAVTRDAHRNVLTPNAILSNWEKLKLALCLSPFLGIAVFLAKLDTLSLNMHKSVGLWLASLVASAWLIYRIRNALLSGELYTRGRYETEGHSYSRQYQPYLFWQTIITWTLGLAMMWTLALLITQ